MNPAGQHSSLQSQYSPSYSTFHRLGGNPAVRALALTLIVSCASIAFLRNFYMTDPDFGWHLRAGEWILAHHGVPFTDPFSSYGAGKSWYDYSWLFDLFFVGLYRAFGLVGFVLLELAFRIAVPLSFYWMARTLSEKFWPSALLALCAAYSIYSIYAPRPGMFTIVFFTFELQLLLNAIKQGNAARLYWLIPLFWVWASIHIQFIHGLIVLGLFSCEGILNRLLGCKMEPAPLPQRSVFVFVASVVATLLTPYSWHIYSTVFTYAGQTHIYETISEMLAMNFRQPYHYVLLLLVFFTVGAMGWSRKIRPAFVLLFLFAALLGFRSVKDAWILAVAALGLLSFVLGETATGPSYDEALPTKHRIAVGVFVVALLALAWRRNDVSNSWIEMGLAGRYPEGAARYIETHHLSGPLYNDFSSGGFLIWRLPAIPVSIDGRTNVHGDDRVKAYTDALKGLPGWEKDPDLERANLIIWTAKSPLPGLLRCDPRFRQVFADPQGVVFVRK